MEVWSENNILKTYSENTPCKEIFQEVCNKIGQHYLDRGWKYAKSRPKITYKDKKVKIEIAFWSSGYNTPGRSVNLEIIPRIYSLELVNHKKAIGETTKGCILGFLELMSERLDNQPAGTKRVINAYGEVKELINEHDLVPEIQYNKNINVYGITEEKFRLLISYIDERITKWIIDLENIDTIDSFINKSTDRFREKLLSSEFDQYLKLKFPDYQTKKSR